MPRRASGCRSSNSVCWVRGDPNSLRIYRTTTFSCATKRTRVALSCDRSRSRASGDVGYAYRGNAPSREASLFRIGPRVNHGAGGQLPANVAAMAMFYSRPATDGQPDPIQRDVEALIQSMNLRVVLGACACSSALYESARGLRRPLALASAFLLIARQATDLPRTWCIRPTRPPSPTHPRPASTGPRERLPHPAAQDVSEMRPDRRLRLPRGLPTRRSPHRRWIARTTRFP